MVCRTHENPLIPLLILKYINYNFFDISCISTDRPGEATIGDGCLS
jgi:hypothetical protein